MHRQDTSSFRLAGATKNAPSAAAIQDWLISRLSESLGVDPGEIDVREPFARYGMSSIAAVGLTGDLEDWLKLRLSPTLTWDYPTIDILSDHLAGEIGGQEVTARTGSLVK
jgi:acyl carrier protein